MEAFRIQGYLDLNGGGFARGLAVSKQGLRGLRQEMRGTAVDAKILQREQRDLTRALRDQSRQVRALTLNYVALRGAMLTLGVRTAVTGLAALTSTVTALAAGTFELAQGAGAAATALGVVGAAAAGSLAQGMIVAQLATKDLWKALTTQGAAHEKALEKLTAPARAFVGELRGAQREYQRLVRIAQAGLFPGLVEGFKAAKPVAGELRQIVYDTARTIGWLGEQFGQLLGRRHADLGIIGERQVVVIRRAGEAALNLGEALIDIYKQAWPLIGHVTADVVRLTEHVRDWTSKNTRSLGGFFGDLRRHYDEWKQIVGGLGGTIFNVMRAANPAVHELNQTLGGLFEKWKAWTGSTKGQSQMRDFFKSQLGPLKAMGGALGALAKAWAELSIAGHDNAIKFWNMIRDHVVPLVRDLGLELNDGFFPSFVDLLGQIADFARAALPGLGELAKVLHLGLKALTGILDVGTGLIEKAPGVSKAILAFGIGAGIIASWAKLKDIMAITLLGIRRVLGLAPEIPVARPGVQRVLGRGGRLDQTLTPTTRSVTTAERGDQPIAPVALAPGGRRALGGAAQRTFLDDGVGVRSGLRTGMRPGVRPIYQRPQWEGVSRVSAQQYTAPIGPRRYFATRVDAGDRNVRPGVVAINQTARRGATERYRAFQNTDLTGRRGRRAALGDLTMSTARSIRTGTLTGLRAGVEGAKPVLKGGFAAAAVSGIIGGLASNEKRIGDRVRDAFSSATFGLFPSAGEKRDQRTEGYTRVLQRQRFRIGDLDQYFDQGRAKLPEWARKALYGGGNGKAGSMNTVIDLRTNPEQVKALKELTDQLVKAGEIAPDVGQKVKGGLRQISQAQQDLMAFGVKGDDLRKALALGLDIEAPSTKVVKGLDRVRKAFDDLGKTRSLSDLKDQVKHNVSVINQELGPKTKVGALALKRNYRLAVGEIHRLMDEGVISTKTGTDLIRQYLVQGILAMNPAWNKKMALAKIHGKDPFSVVDFSIGAGTQMKGRGNAQGGLHRVPGKTGPDSVPVNLGGVPSIVAPGEDIAVINRHQRAFLDARLADVGGLPGVFRKIRTPHHADRRGFNQGSMVQDRAGGRGGWRMLSGDLDFVAALGNALERMAETTGQRISVQEGRRTLAEQQALVDAKGAWSPSNPGAAPATPNAPHVQGIAADITPGRERFGSVAGRFGLGFTVGNEPWHIQLLNAIANGGGALAGGKAGASLAGVPWPKVPQVAVKASGLVAELVNTGLAGARNAAQATIDRIHGQLAAAQQRQGIGAGFTGPWVSVMGQIAKAQRWKLADWKWLVDAESGGNPEAVNPSSGAFGLGQFLGSTLDAYRRFGAASHDPVEQIRAMAQYIKDRYGSPSAARAFHEAHNWYAAGGMPVARAASAAPPRGGAVPDVTIDVPTGSQPKPKAGEKRTEAYNPATGRIEWHTASEWAHIRAVNAKNRAGGRGRRPTTDGPGYPKVSKIKGRKVKPKLPKEWRSSYRRWELPEGADALPKGLVPDLAKLYDTPIDSFNNLLTRLQGQFDLSSEEPLATYQDSGSFKDLTDFWARNPELAKEWAGVVDEWTTVNWDGYTQQGKFVPGVHQHVSELEQLLLVHSGSRDGTRREPGQAILGLLLGEQAEVGHSLARVRNSRGFSVQALREIRLAWKGEKDRNRHATRKAALLNSSRYSWQQRVADNKARIDAIEDWKRQVRQATVGHVQSDRLRRQLVKADQDLADLRDENSQLETEQPPPTQKVPKGASKAERRRIQDANRRRARQLRKATRDASDSAQEMEYLDGSTQRWTTTGGIAQQWKSRLDAHDDALSQLGETARQLAEVQIPSEELAIKALIQERADWLGTTAILPTRDTSAADSERADLQKQIADNALRDLATSQANFAALSSFQGLVKGRLVGAFAHGARAVPETGLALVHKNETIVTDPDGPFRTGPNSAARLFGGGQPPVVYVEIDGDLQPLVRQVRVVAGDEAKRQIAATGGRARRLQSAPGRLGG